jgi:hypothetical protein
LTVVVVLVEIVHEPGVRLRQVFAGALAAVPVMIATAAASAAAAARW